MFSRNFFNRAIIASKIEKLHARFNQASKPAQIGIASSIIGVAVLGIGSDIAEQISYQQQPLQTMRIHVTERYLNVIETREGVFINKTYNPLGFSRDIKETANYDVTFKERKYAGVTLREIQGAKLVK